MATLATEAVAAQCRGTPTVQVTDNRGMAVRSLQHNRSVASERPASDGPSKRTAIGRDEAAWAAALEAQTYIIAIRASMP